MGLFDFFGKCTEGMGEQKKKKKMAGLYDEKRFFYCCPQGQTNQITVALIFLLFTMPFCCCRCAIVHWNAQKTGEREEGRGVKGKG